MNKEEWFITPANTRRLMASDFHRPIYHFLPPKNWMNDPNGLFFWQNRYHLFYQFNPYAPLWGFIHWGHASSPDMVHWQDHPIALFPEANTGDAFGCWSGCIIEDGGIPSALYTGFVSPDETPVMLARAEDDRLEQWKKSPHNPVICTPPTGVTQTDFRDPYVWREENQWKMVMGAGMLNGNSSVLLYQSADLVEWEDCGVLFEKQVMGVRMWECPNFFSLGDRYVLLVSLFPDAQGVYYYVGDYDGSHFVPTSEGYYDAGPSLYAPHVRTFQDGRTILFAWLMEQRSDEALETAGWAGVQAIPRQLSLGKNGKLVGTPIDELHHLRRDHHHFSGLVLADEVQWEVPDRGRHLTLEMVAASAAGEVKLGVLTSYDGEEVTWIGIDFDQNTLFMDTTQSSQDSEVKTGIQKVDLTDRRSLEVQLHVFVDGSVIEAWTDDGAFLTGRAYPTRHDADGVVLRSTGGEVSVPSLEAWQMESIWLTAGESGH